MVSRTLNQNQVNKCIEPKLYIHSTGINTNNTKYRPGPTLSSPHDQEMERPGEILTSEAKWKKQNDFGLNGYVW